MTNPMIRIHDLTTNEIIDREMTEDEYAEFLNPSYLQEPEYIQQQATQAVKDADKAALLAKLGITADEAKLLLG